MATARTALTLEEFLQLLEEEPALEYIGGVVSQKVSPKLRHGFLQAQLVARINVTALQSRVAMAATEVRTTFDGESRVPDVVVFRWDRVPRDPSGELADDVLISPDVAIEIVSPGQSVRALHDRCRWYVGHGVEIALLVNQARMSVTAFRADGTVLEWQGDDRIDLGPVVPGFDLTVGALFRSLSE